MKTETKTYEISASPGLLRRLDRFLALLHWNSRFGHSALFGMWLDGDGDDKVTVQPEPEYQQEVGLVGGIGGAIEIANSNGFSCADVKDMGSSWEVRNIPSRVMVPTLLRNGEVVRQSSIPEGAEAWPIINSGDNPVEAKP